MELEKSYRLRNLKFTRIIPQELADELNLRHGIKDSYVSTTTKEIFNPVSYIFEKKLPNGMENLGFKPTENNKRTVFLNYVDPSDAKDIIDNFSGSRKYYDLYLCAIVEVRVADNRNGISLIISKDSAPELYGVEKEGKEAFKRAMRPPTLDDF